MAALEEHSEHVGGRRVAVCDHALVYRDGDDLLSVLPLADAVRELEPALPVDQTALLAAMATGIALGLPIEAIRAGLTMRPAP